MSTKATILFYLQQQNYSGTQLAEKLNISRNAVWKAIQSLVAEGFVINKQKTGYHLVAQPTTLNETCIQAAFLKDTVHVYQSIDSTNTQAKLYTDTISTRGVFIANEQTAGRGRYGRTFYSPMGCGLYISAIYPAKTIQKQLSLVTPLAAVAVSRAITTQLGINVGIKWVNDLFLNGKKISGILTEAIYSVEAGMLDYIIVGIGINVTTPQNIPDELVEVIGYLTDEPVDMNALSIAIISELFTLLDTLPNTDFMSEYIERSILIGQSITVQKPNETFHAVVKDITLNGLLVIETDTQKILTLEHGEVSIRLNKGE